MLAVHAFRDDPWLDRVGPATVFDVEVRPAATKHSISLQQVERGLAGATANPNEASKKAKLKMLLVKSWPPRHSYDRGHVQRSKSDAA